MFELDWKYEFQPTSIRLVANIPSKFWRDHGRYFYSKGYLFRKGRGRKSLIIEKGIYQIWANSELGKPFKLGRRFLSLNQALNSLKLRLYQWEMVEERFALENEFWERRKQDAGRRKPRIRPL